MCARFSIPSDVRTAVPIRIFSWFSQMVSVGLFTRTRISRVPEKVSLAGSSFRSAWYSMGCTSSTSARRVFGGLSAASALTDNARLRHKHKRFMTLLSFTELAQVMAAESRLDGWVPPLFWRRVRRPLRYSEYRGQTGRADRAEESRRR